MVICFSCDGGTKQLLDILVRDKQYDDYTEVIQVAIANLAVLHGDVDDARALIIGSEGSRGFGEIGDLARAGPSANRVPELFHLDGVGDAPTDLPDLPPEPWSCGEPVPVEEWIFGQYNRLLPAKASCRALAHLLRGQSNGAALEEAAHQIASEAAILGDYLRDWDEQHDLDRDEALATAFPSTGRGGDKGRLRYANQFVGRADSQGRVSGLMMAFKLIGQSEEKNPRVMLTEIGWRFGAMPNPVLEGKEEDSAQKFSAEEAGFLVEHVARCVPAEDFAYRTILAAICDGADTPTELDAALREHVSSDARGSFSEAFLATQRSGAISRMADLGLVDRVRHGVRVSYAITDLGVCFVKRA